MPYLPMMIACVLSSTADRAHMHSLRDRPAHSEPCLQHSRTFGASCAQNVDIRTALPPIPTFARWQESDDRIEGSCRGVSDRNRLAAYLHSIGGDARLLTGWRVTITASGTSAVSSEGGISGCFISREGKRFRSFDGVARHLGLLGTGQQDRPAPATMRPPPPVRRASAPECRAFGHRFNQEADSRRCTVCKKLVAPPSHSRYAAVRAGADFMLGHGHSAPELFSLWSEQESATEYVPPSKVRRLDMSIEVPFYLQTGEVV